MISSCIQHNQSMVSSFVVKHTTTQTNNVQPARPGRIATFYCDEITGRPNNERRHFGDFTKHSNQPTIRVRALHCDLTPHCEQPTQPTTLWFIQQAIIMPTTYILYVQDQDHIILSVK